MSKARDDEAATHTSRLAREIDAAYSAYKNGEPDSERRLHKALEAQARNVVSDRLRKDDPMLALNIAHRAFLTLESFHGRSMFSTWFCSVARNEINREMRRRIAKIGKATM